MVFTYLIDRFFHRSFLWRNRGSSGLGIA